MQKGLEIIKTNSKVCSTTKLCKYHIHLAQHYNKGMITYQLTQKVYKEWKIANGISSVSGKLYISFYLQTNFWQIILRQNTIYDNYECQN